MPNANPVAGTNSWFISNSTALLPAQRVTANDSDADGDTLTVTSVINGTNGTVSLTAGVIQFNPAGGATIASFDYTVDDGNGGTAVGTVSIDIVNTSYKFDLVTVPASADFAYVDGRTGKDTIIGGEGPDTLIGGSQSDSLDGGDGNDFLVAGAGGGVLTGGEGDDVLDLTEGGEYGGTGYGGDGSDTIYGGGQFSLLDGGPGIDVLFGGGHANRIFVDDPNDMIFGHAKAVYSTATSFATGSVSHTLILLDGAIDGTGGDPPNRIYGNAADNTLSGLGANDLLSGSDGNDTLDGGASADTLVGGAGDDSLDGGTGALSTDTASYEGSGPVTVSLAITTAQNTGGAGIDTLVRVENLKGGDAGDRLTGDAARNRLEGGAGNDTMSGGNGHDSLAGGLGADMLRGAAGNDTLLGHIGADRLLGGADNDTAAGGEDDDLILGGAGNDNLLGDQGDDVLKGEAGNDSINGGTGLDTAVFAGNVDDYEITIDGDVVTVTDLAPSVGGDDGTDTLIDVEQLRFVDSVVDIPRVLGTIDLADLTIAEGFVIFGAEVADLLGVSVNSAGDVNGDGFDDVIIGARYGDAAGNAKSYAGESYVIFGSGTGFGASIDTATLAAAQGFVIHGADANDWSGRSVGGAGDVNGDGFDDVIVGAPYAETAGSGESDAGESYVIFGTDAGFGASIDLAALTPAEGFVISGAAANDFSGRSVSGAGDVNDDGFDDLIIGTHAGAAYVLLGHAGEFPTNVDLGSLDGTDGFKLLGAGSPVGSAGDVNGDGFDDVIIGATYASDAGKAYVVFGTDAGFAASLDLATLTSAQGFVINGEDYADKLGFAVDTAGDVNGDGFDDLVIGARSGDGPGNTRSDVGDTYVIFGTDADFGASVELGTLTSAQGFVVYGADGSGLSGSSVSSAGDINGDGFGDIIIGAYHAHGSLGASYVVFGSDGGFGTSLDLASLTPAQGFAIFGADPHDYSGFSVSSAGDVNGDDFDDLIVSGHLADAAGNAKNAAGESYVIFGAASLAALTASAGDLEIMQPDNGGTVGDFTL